MKYLRKEIIHDPKKGIIDSLRKESFGVYHQVMRATHIHNLFDMAERIRNVAAYEGERDQLWYRIDCVNGLSGDCLIFDLHQCPKAWQILFALKKTETIEPWGNDSKRIGGKDKLASLHKALKKVYGIDRFCSMIMINDGHWNGRGTLIRI